MAYINGNFRNPKQIGMLESIGQKAKSVIEFGVGLKNAWDPCTLR